MERFFVFSVNRNARKQPKRKNKIADRTARVTDHA